MDGPVVHDHPPGYYLAHLIAALEDIRERRERAAPTTRRAADHAPVAEGASIWSASDGGEAAMSDAAAWAGCLA
jgi:hypothetical protein